MSAETPVLRPSPRTRRQGQVAGPWVLLLSAVLVFWGFLAFGFWTWWDRDADPRQRHDVQVMDLPAYEADAVMTAAATWVDPDTEVLGVSAGGRHRAYVLSTFNEIDRHVANDRLGDVPVTVCYCDRMDMAQAFTGGTGSEPLDMACGGFKGQYDWGTMLVRVGRWNYRLDNGQALEKDAPPFPYATQELTRTTWAAWREAHPDTDIYVGDGHHAVVRDLPVAQAAPAVPPDSVPLKDDAEVVGVTVADQHRAYPVLAFRPQERQVLHDHIGDVPVVVAFGGRSPVARALAAAAPGGPPDVAGGGMSDANAQDGILIRAGAWHYHLTTGRPVEQDAPPFPLPRAACERTTWKAWRQAHPDTDLSPVDVAAASYQRHL